MENSPLIAPKNNPRKKLIRCFVLAVCLMLVIALTATMILYFYFNGKMKHGTTPFTGVELLNLTIAGNFSANLPAIVHSIKKSYCPFNDFHGPSVMCGNQTNLNQTNVNQKALKQKNTQLPLKVIVGTGFDPITGQIKLPFLQLSYDEGKTYQSLSGATYLVPDQVTLTNADLNSKTMNVRIFNNINDYLTNFDPNRTTINSGTLGVPINDLPNFIHFFGSGTNYISSVTEYRTNFNLTYTGNLSIVSSVQTAIDSLPQVYDPLIYKMFIDYWGTSIVLSGVSGGFCQQTVMMKQCFGGVDFTSQSELYIYKQLYSASYDHVDFAAGFTQYSKANLIDIFGGDPKYFDPSQWADQRVPSIDDDPVLTNVQTVPIVDFIMDPVIKANLQKAINDYYTIGINSINQYRNDYFNDIRSAKDVYYVGVRRGRIVDPSVATIAANQDYYVKPIQAFPTHCQRDSNGSLFAIITQADINAFYGKTYWHGFAMLQSNGAGVYSGCSVSHIKLYYGVENLPVIDVYNFCCMGCIPTNNVANVCSCPTF